MAYLPFGPQPPDFPGYGTGEASYGSAPYAEAAARAQARLGLRDRLLAGLAGLGSVQPGMNFGQSFLAAAGGSARATWAAKQAAMNYAQRQADQEMAQQQRDVSQRYMEAQIKQLERPPKEDKPEKDILAEAEKILGRPLTPTERAIKAGVYREPPKPEKKESDKPSIKDYGAIQSNFVAEPTVKTYGKIRDSYQVITESAKLASGFGDMAMITAYAKSLDADTGVKEQEFNNASEAIGYLQKAYNAPNKWFRGTRLTPEGRTELLKSAKALYQARKRSYDTTAANYRRVATKYGVDPNDIIFDYGDVQDSTAVPPVTTVPSHRRQGGIDDSFLR